MFLENPSFLKRLVLRKIDPAFFYWIFCCFRTIVSIVDFILDMCVGYTITKGSR
jgi:hypothetical protein